MEAFFANLPAVISASGTIAAAWFAYNQYSKNKLTDMKIERFKQEETAKSLRRADNSAIVFGELWSVLHELHADRVYIVQPHPLGNESFVSVFYEVKRKGVEPMKPRIQNLHISEIAKFASDLVKNQFVLITNIEKQVGDKYARAILSSCGCQSAIIERMNDNKYDWVGSIFCEFTHRTDIEKEEAQKIMHNAATNIQYILPEYR